MNSLLKIDCNAYPFIPNKWRLKCHKKTGLSTWHPDNIEICPLRNPKIKYCIPNIESALNANALDHLLANPILIPEFWKGKVILFFGTQYYDSVGNICVRYLCWFYGKEWGWSCRWINCPTIGSFLEIGSAALLKSP